MVLQKNSSYKVWLELLPQKISNFLEMLLAHPTIQLISQGTPRHDYPPLSHRFQIMTTPPLWNPLIMTTPLQSQINSTYPPPALLEPFRNILLGLGSFWIIIFLKKAWAQADPSTALNQFQTEMTPFLIWYDKAFQISLIFLDLIWFLNT